MKHESQFQLDFLQQCCFCQDVVWPDSTGQTPAFPIEQSYACDLKRNGALDGRRLSEPVVLQASRGPVSSEVLILDRSFVRWVSH